MKQPLLDKIADKRALIGIVATNHDAFDYVIIRDRAQLIIDARGV